VQVQIGAIEDVDDILTGTILGHVAAFKGVHFAFLEVQAFRWVRNTFELCRCNFLLDTKIV